MVQSLPLPLDAAFAALADATRRGVLERLARADASITALAAQFGLTLTGMRKHVRVLEAAGLVVSEKRGRVRTCRVSGQGLEVAAAWIEAQRQIWEARFGQLDALVGELKKEQDNGRKRDE